MLFLPFRNLIFVHVTLHKVKCLNLCDPVLFPFTAPNQQKLTALTGYARFVHSPPAGGRYGPKSPQRKRAQNGSNRTRPYLANQHKGKKKSDLKYDHILETIQMGG